MLNHALCGLFKAVPSIDLPLIIVRNNSSDILVMPISDYDYAHIRMRFGAF